MPAFPINISGSPYTITTAGISLTYDQFLATLAYTSYKVKSIFIESDTFSQISTSFTWERVKPDGKLFSQPTSANIDPMQYTSVILTKTDDEISSIDINTSLSFTLNPSSVIEIMFFTEANSMSYMLNKQQANVKTDQKILPIKNRETSDAFVAAILLISGIGLYKIFSRN